jgi:hypothetical protein
MFESKLNDELEMINRVDCLGQSILNEPLIVELDKTLDEATSFIGNQLLSSYQSRLGLTRNSLDEAVSRIAVSNTIIRARRVIFLETKDALDKRYGPLSHRAQTVSSGFSIYEIE